MKDLIANIKQSDVKIDTTYTAQPAEVVRIAQKRGKKGKSLWKDEHQFQKAVCDQALLLSVDYAEADLLFAVPNGQYRDGQRLEAGVRSGVPDLCLPVARRGYHSLYIELKINGNTTSAEQDQWIARLRSQGHRVEVIDSDLNAAISLLKWYLGKD